MHLTAHAGVCLAEAQVIGRAGDGRLALCPVPVPAVLQVDDVHRVISHNWPAGLKTQMVHTTQRLLEHLRSHDRRANRQHHPAVELLECPGERLKIDLRRPANRRTVEHRMVRDNVVPNPWMHGQRHPVSVGRGDD